MKSIKTKLGKKQKQNRTLPHWTRLRTGNKISGCWWLRTQYLLFIVCP
ncbi:unnamed protein product [Echinostoma caproni]|uniref:60S ribosomal protein L39 n=1 Tax=Echinostoma caproni TaxID=27848 RepID=A0A3P8HF37_9TREM|nr:unnamed protein product [Echinostoma caproni]